MAAKMNFGKKMKKSQAKEEAEKKNQITAKQLGFICD